MLALEALLRDLTSDSDQYELMRGHLEGARFYLAGGMPGEYDLNLNLARTALPTVANPDLRFRVEQFLLGAEHPTH